MIKILNKKEMEEIRRYNNKIASFFDMPPQKFKIKITTKKELNKIAKKNFQWLISTTDKNIIYILNRKKIKQDFFETLKHELVHIYVHKKFPETAGFIDEGFAEYFSRPYKKDWQKSLLKQKIDIVQFMSGKVKKYLSAFSIVYFLIKKFTKKDVFQLASQLKSFNKMSTKETNKIFSSVLRMNLTEFEKEWHNFIKNESS